MLSNTQDYLVFGFSIGFITNVNNKQKARRSGRALAKPIGVKLRKLRRSYEVL